MKKRSGKLAVLVIDDDMELLSLARKMLEGLGFDVLTSQTGTEGIKLASAKRPDAILLDIAMSDISGIEVLKLLKSSPRTLDIPVLMVTGYNDERMIHAAISEYAVQYFVKPVNYRAVAEFIRTLYPG